MAVVLGVIAMPPSQATFPGANGKLAWIQDADLWTALPNGGSPAKLIDDADHPAWSVDGAWLLFDRQVSGKGDVFKVSANATLTTNLTNHAADVIQPRGRPTTTGWSSPATGSATSTASTS